MVYNTYIYNFCQSFASHIYVISLISAGSGTEKAGSGTEKAGSGTGQWRHGP
jgi:hypothetical protein